jgi:hypothetical protein
MVWSSTTRPRSSSGTKSRAGNAAKASRHLRARQRAAQREPGTPDGVGEVSAGRLPNSAPDPAVEETQSRLPPWLRRRTIRCSSTRCAISSAFYLSPGGVCFFASSAIRLPTHPQQLQRCQGLLSGTLFAFPAQLRNSCPITGQRPAWALRARLGVLGDGSDDGGSSAVLSAQRVEQRLGLLQIGRIEALREPAMDRPQEIAGVVAFALVAPQPAKAAGSPQFP